MKRKELFKRLTAVSMSAMMAVTMIPTTAFASEDDFFAGDQETVTEVTEEAVPDLGEDDFESGAEASEEEAEGFESEDGFVSDDGETDELSDFQSDAAPQDENEEGTPAADATVHVTISNAGVLANAKDGSLMAQKDVTVTDLDKNGILTYDEALIAVHNAYYEGGAAVGYATADSEQYGKYLTKLWGDESGAFGYWLNDGSCMGLSDVVKADDYLTAFIYKDTTGYSDSYSKFGAKEYEATTGKPVTVSVENVSKYDENYKPVFAAFDEAVLTAYDESFKALAAEDYTIDGYNVTFNKAGTYYLVTGGTEEVKLVPAVAKVVVKDEEQEAKSYLQSLRIGGIEVYETGKTSYYGKLSANAGGVSVGALLSDNAPEGSVITAKYYNVNTGENAEKVIKASPTRNYSLSYSAKTDYKPVSFTITVGTEDDYELYTINLTRSVAMSVTISQADDTSLKSTNNTYYVPEEYTDPIVVSVSTYGAKIDINGDTVEDKEKYSFTPKYDENNEYQLKITATSSENSNESLTKEYTLKRLTADTVITGTQGNTLNWTLKNGELTISGSGTVPSSNQSWSIFKEKITSLVIEEGITRIDWNAFSNDYTALKSAVLPNGLTDCSFAFRYSPLESITASSLGSYEFYYCSDLKNVTLKDTVTEIPENVFANCSSLESVTIPNGVTVIGDSAFAECASLKSVTIPEGVTSIGASAFEKCTSLESITIPEGVTSIGTNAFADCTSLKEITIPATCENVSGYLFKGCTSLTSVTIKSDKYVTQNGVVYSADMKTAVFCPVYYKGKVTIPEGVTEIAEGTFFGCSQVTRISLPTTLTSIGDDSFNGCALLNDVTIPENVTSIGTGIFQGCTSLTNVKLPSGLTEITKSMFQKCTSLKKIDIPNSVTKIGASAFSGCTNLENIELSDAITEILASAFANCEGLTEFKVPTNVTTVPDSMLQNAINVETVSLPAGLTSLGRNAFSGLNSLKYVLFAGTREQWDSVTPSWNKPTAEMILYGCTSIGNPENAPVIVEQPQTNSFALNRDATDSLSVKAEALNANEKYFITWYKNTQNSTTGSTIISGTMTEDGIGSTATPATNKKENAYYYCVIQKVDASGAATWTYSDIVEIAVGADLFEKGSGTSADPYQLNSIDDLLKLKQIVKDGNSVNNNHFILTEDITLPDDWTPIGETIDGTESINGGRNLHAFSGILDGNNKTITIPENGLPLLGYIANATVKNLNIYGKKIAGYGLVNNFYGVGLSGNAIIIDNVTLKSGSSTLKSGLIGSYIGKDNGVAGCSADFVATIRNCTIESGVVIGYNKDQKMIGSIAGRMQGTIENCVSHATVYGTDYVGGIMGTRDNAMGTCSVRNCSFDGTVEASGQQVGGIVGGGYSDSSAPNGRRQTISGCTSAGTVTGADKVGGILGADIYVAQSWDNCVYTMKANSFTGKIKATGENAAYIGGVIGYFNSLNKYDVVENNYYSKDCGAEKGIGFVKYVDTNCATHETASEANGTVYINTEIDASNCPPVAGCNWRSQHNRTDDPLGADADKLASSTKEVGLYAEELDITGKYKTEFYVGDDLDLTGMKIKAKMSDGTTRDLEVSDLIIEGYNKDKRGEQSVKLSYEGASQIVLVRVLRKDAGTIKVTFSLLGDKKHNSDKDKDYHTLRANNLETWIDAKEYEVDGNATVLDVISDILIDNEYTWDNAKGNYIQSITPKNGETLSGEGNGKNSGWMYTLNGIHSNLGVREQFLEDGDIIVFHYTDDYTQEHDHIWDSKWASDENAHWHECTYAYNKCDITDNAKKEGYAAHSFDGGKVTKEATCKEAGVKTYTCTVCGFQKTETIQKTEDHTFDAGKVTKEATCKEAGVKTYTCTVCGFEKTEAIPKTENHTFDAGKVTKEATYKEAGEKVYTCTVCGFQKTEVIPVIAHDHDFTWTVVSQATVFAAEKQEGICSICGEKQTRDNGTALAATIKLNVETLPLQKKQTTKKVTVTMANGDSVVSWKSSNKKIATVDKNGVIKAGNKKGTAKITVTLKSGKTATLTVKVQSAKVATKKITGLKSTVTLKKGKKLTLKPILSPITSQDKVTYTSSNKKIATVSSKGVITGKKKGTAKITVKAGKKKFTVKVKVK